MDTNYTLVYLKLIEEVAQDGELNHKEIRQLAKWLNDNEEGSRDGCTLIHGGNPVRPLPS